MSESLTSIIIPAKNCEETIEKCLNSVLNLEYKNYEVIVVDDASNDRTCEIIAKFTPKIKIITNNIGIGPSKSRNIAANEAGGEFLAFTDSDCIVDKDWLNQLKEGFNRYPDAVGCGGIQLLPSDATNFEKRIFLLMQKVGFISDYMRIVKSSDLIEVKHNASCCVMYRKDVFLKNGGFLEGLWPGEDVEFDFRLKKQGLKLVFNPKAIVCHYRPKYLGSFAKMMFRYGWAQGALVRRYGIFRKIHLIPVGNLLFLSMCIFMVRANKMLALLFVMAATLIILLYLRSLLATMLIFIGNIYWNLGFMRGTLIKDFMTNTKRFP